MKLKEGKMKKEESITDYNGKEMDTITFRQLVKELTGHEFEEVYKDYFDNGELNAKSESDLG